MEEEEEGKGKMKRNGRTKRGKEVRNTEFISMGLHSIRVYQFNGSCYKSAEKRFGSSNVLSKDKFIALIETKAKKKKKKIYEWSVKKNKKIKWKKRKKSEMKVREVGKL